MIEVVDNTEIQEILDILEQCSDEEYAVRLLKEFNDRTKELGLLLMNRDKNITHDDWEKKCSIARKKVDEILSEIRQCR